MAKRKSRGDINQIAASIVERSTRERPHVFNTTDIAPNESVIESSPKNPAAVALGRLGGLKGGKARAAKLSAHQRKSIAKKAAKTRWKNRKSDNK